MTIRKVADIKIKASAYGRMKASGTGMKFYSYDKNSAAIDFHFFNQDNTPTDLIDAKVNLLLLTEENGEWKEFTIIDDGLEIISEMEGTARYIIPDELRGYVGTVQGYVALNFNDGSRTDECYFDFKMERSKFEEQFDAAGGYYIREIEDSLDEVIAELKKYAQEKIKEYNAEFVTLNTKILAVQTSIGKTQTDVSALNTKITELQNKQAAIEKLITDNDVATKTDLEKAKAESSANVINIVTGKKEVELTFVLDLKDKIAGSDVENKHSYRYVSLTDGILPATPIVGTEVGNTGDWEDYGLLYDLDNKIFTTTTATAGKSAAHVARWNLLEEVKEFLGDKFFTAIGATDVASQVAFIRSKGTSLVGNTWGFGSSASGNKLSCGMYRQRDKDWPYNSPNTQNSVKKMSSNINPSSIPFYIADDGFVTEIAYAEPSDGVTQSATRVDYSNLEFKMKISMSEYFNSLIAANHVENLATQDEAESGTDNAKTMTPLRTAQQINKKAVTIAGNQTIGGIKNFKDGLMINDVSLSTITRKVIYEADGVGGYFNAADKFTLGASGKIDKIVLLWSRVDDTAGTLLNYSWSQTVLSPDDLVVGNSYRIQMTTDNYKFVTFANESGNVTISGANENSVAPNRIYRIKRIIAYLKN